MHPEYLDKQRAILVVDVARPFNHREISSLSREDMDKLCNEISHRGSPLQYAATALSGVGNTVVNPSKNHPQFFGS